MKKQTVENGSCNSNYTVNGFHDNEQASMMVSTLELNFPQQGNSFTSFRGTVKEEEFHYYRSKEQKKMKRGMTQRKPAKKVEEVQRNALSATPAASITWVLVILTEEREEVTSHLPHRLRQQVQRHIPLAGTTSTRAKMEARKNVS